MKKSLPLLKSNLWIAVFFGVLVTLALGMQIYGTEPIKNLGGNLVAEFIGALVTVLVSII